MVIDTFLHLTIQWKLQQGYVASVIDQCLLISALPIIAQKNAHIAI